MSAVTEAREYVGGLSNPSKMPGMSYSIPAERCKVGSKLRKVKGSTCSKCYALKGCYVFPVVKDALERRYKSLSRPLWVENMVIAINKQPFFRWHDAGDLQSFEHLAAIVNVCKLTPETKHWLPTREVKIVRAFVRVSDIPANLAIRISGTMIDGEAVKVSTDFNRWLPTSTVHDKTSGLGHVCPAPKQNNSCGDCRACWNPTIDNVSYMAH